MQNSIIKRFNLLFLFSILLFTYSCERDDNSGQKEIQQNKNINSWIQSNMDVLYYWNTQMPTKKDVTLSPDKYFKSILYTAEDRFSYIAKDFAQLSDLLSGVQMEAGYDFTLFLKEEGSKDVIGVINYIKPNSPASSTNLKRGDIFFTVNGKQLTTDNYQDVMNETYAPHTLGIYKDGVIQNISLSVTKYEENPVFLDSIYNIGGKKIAYLIFNFFSTDNGDYSYSYVKALNDIFGKYKQANVNDLILDLRYNGGGQVDVAVALASMISNRTSSDLFCTDEYNSIVDKELQTEMGDSYNKTYFNDNIEVKNENGDIVDRSIPINKLGLNHLYVLVTGSTASASELLINGLKPYMNVTLIGETTYGKNVAMWFIYETDPQKQKDNRWGMLPIVCKTFNSANQSDYSKGFTPDIEADEYETMPLLPLGNTDEPMLAAAFIQLGVKSANTLRSEVKEINPRPLMSSIDRTPVRKNMFHKRRQSLVQ